MSIFAMITSVILILCRSIFLKPISFRPHSYEELWNFLFLSVLSMCPYNCILSFLIGREHVYACARMCQCVHTCCCSDVFVLNPTGGCRSRKGTHLNGTLTVIRKLRGVCVFLYYLWFIQIFNNLWRYFLIHFSCNSWYSNNMELEYSFTSLTSRCFLNIRECSFLPSSLSESQVDFLLLTAL